MKHHRNKKLVAEDKIVYVPMAADLIHHGHMNIINEARKLGRVVIGLMTDKAIATYKRVPYLSYSEREKIIAGIAGVSEVVPQFEHDYVPNLRKLKPHYVVHGDDWKTGVQKEARARVVKVLKEWKGKLVEPKYTGNISSTGIQAALKEIGTTADVRLKRFQRLLDAKSVIRGIEVHSGITGLIAENAAVSKRGKKEEFDFMWLSSLTDSTAKGKPDIELVDSTSRLNTIHDILDVTTKPLVYDGDTGGPSERFPYLVRTLERLGVSAVIIEDKKGLKRNSLFGTSVRQEQETPRAFAEKIRAGKRAQVTPDFFIIARIESFILGKGIEDALLRARTYLKAGADGIMIHSKEKNPKEILAFARAYRKIPNAAPLVAVPTTYDTLTEEELRKAGFSVVIYANHLLRSAYPAMLKTAESILKHGRAAEASAEYCMPISEILTLIQDTHGETR